MAKTVVGLFDTRAEAEQVTQALVDSGVARDDISVVANDSANGTAVGDTSTTGDSAATGAATGAVGGGVLGGALGLLVGLGALAIPGIGPIIAAGPIAAALGAAGTTALVGAGIGAVSGGLLGALVGAGIPEEDAHYYAEGVRRGGTLVMARVDDTLTGTAYNVMQQYGAIDIENRGAEWRSSGWDRFNPEGGEWERSSKVGTTGGAVAGAATGAAIGSAGGPIGTVIGGAAGAFTGAMAGGAGDAVGEEATEAARAGDVGTSGSYDTSVRDTSTSDMGTTGTTGTTASTGTTDYTGQRGSGEPVMSDANDYRPTVGSGQMDATRRRGGRIYGDNGRYDWDPVTSTAVAAGAANTSNMAGSSGTMGAVPLGGVAAAAASTEINRDADTYNRTGGVDRGETPTEEWEESSKIGTGTGAVAGAATGAAIGSVGGPIGTVIGGAAGAITGAVTGAAGDAAGEATEDAATGEDDVVEREATNDVGGRKGQVQPRE